MRIEKNGRISAFLLKITEKFQVEDCARVKAEGGKRMTWLRNSKKPSIV